MPRSHLLSIFRLVKKSFYQTTKNELNSDWNEWLMRWRSKLNIDDRFLITKDMKLSNSSQMGSGTCKDEEVDSSGHHPAVGT